MGEFEHVRDVFPEAVNRKNRRSNGLPRRVVEESGSSLLSQSRAVIPEGLNSLSLVAEDVCQICKGFGRLRKKVPLGHPDFGKDFPCPCKQQELREKWQRKMIVLSERFGFQRDQILTTFRRQVRGVQEAYEQAMAMIERLEMWAQHRDVKQKEDIPAEWLLLQGPVGAGKTHLAMGIVNACIDAGIVALFATAPDLLDYLRATYEPGTTVTYDDLFTQLRDAEVLVLDDLGSQRSSSWADEKIFQMLNYRYNFRWPTVITLNPKVWPSLDERVSSRLQDVDLVRVVNMSDAQDYRQRNRRSEQ